MQRRLWVPAAIAFLALSPLQSFALPGEASAIIQHCGTPSRDWQATSPVTGTLQRNLNYGNTILRFDSTAGGWSYTSAWRNEHPTSLKVVETALPCVADALNEVAKSPTSAGDPTLVADHSTTSLQGLQFGKPFLWLVAILALILFVSLAIPATRKRVIRRPALQERVYRRPKVQGFRFARRIKKAAVPVDSQDV